MLVGTLAPTLAPEVVAIRRELGEENLRSHCERHGSSSGDSLNYHFKLSRYVEVHVRTVIALAGSRHRELAKLGPAM